MAFDGRNDFVMPVWRRTFGIKESAAEAFLSGHPPQDAKKKKKRYPLLERASFFVTVWLH